ncbi:hypothetical protein ACFL5S_01055 [Fibrobacterota bacterium]
MKKLISGLCLCILFCGIVTAAYSDGFHVPSDYPTIQDAINETGSGSDKIFLDPNYLHTVLNVEAVSKHDIVITSDPDISGTAVIYAEEGDSWVLRFLYCSEITIENVRFEAAYSYYNNGGRSMIDIGDCNNCSILDNQIVYNGTYNDLDYAINIVNSNYIYIRENYIDNFYYGIHERSESYGYWGAHDYTNNTIWGCTDGILWEQYTDTQRPRFWNNDIYWAYNGVNAYPYNDNYSYRLYFSTHGNNFWWNRYPIWARGDFKKTTVYHSNNYYQRCRDRFLMDENKVDRVDLLGDSWYKCDNRLP